MVTEKIIGILRSVLNDSEKNLSPVLHLFRRKFGMNEGFWKDCIHS